MLKTLSIIVSGKVQGVFYRKTAKDKAIEIGVKGEIKNMPDETVHLTATGTSEQLEKLIEWCKQGPPRAEVANVLVEELQVRSFDEFRVVR
jgi:acylphosphatase